MATVEVSFLQGQLEERKRRLETAIASTTQSSDLTNLLREVDAAWRLVARIFPPATPEKRTISVRGASSRRCSRRWALNTAPPTSW